MVVRRNTLTKSEYSYYYKSYLKKVNELSFYYPFKIGLCQKLDLRKRIEADKILNEVQKKYLIIKLEENSVERNILNREVFYWQLNKTHRRRRALLIYQLRVLGTIKNDRDYLRFIMKLYKSVYHDGFGLHYKRPILEHFMDRMPSLKFQNINSNILDQQVGNNL